jgi:hypothetical protein
MTKAGLDRHLNCKCGCHERLQVPQCGFCCYGEASTAEQSPEPRLRKLDGKFSVHPEKGIVNTVSGEAIPEDEPLFLLRGRDHHALEAIQAYRSICAPDCNSLHMEGINQTANKFALFRVEHPERMKQPGITKHLKLESGSVGESPAPATPEMGTCEYNQAGQGAARLAQKFHEAYERLAPQFGYEAKPWLEIPHSQRMLMIAVCQELLEASTAEQSPAPESAVDRAQFRLGHSPYETDVVASLSRPSRTELEMGNRPHESGKNSTDHSQVCRRCGFSIGIARSGEFKGRYVHGLTGNVVCALLATPSRCQHPGCGNTAKTSHGNCHEHWGESPAPAKKLCRCPEGTCLMHPNSPEAYKTCSFNRVAAPPEPPDEREAFIQWAGNLQHWDIGLWAEGRFLDPNIQRAWEAWSNRQAKVSTLEKALQDAILTIESLLATVRPGDVIKAKTHEWLQDYVKRLSGESRQ